MNTTTKGIIAQNIQKNLDINNMSQTDLAEKIGVSTSTVSLWVLGKNAPRAGMVDKICKALNITREELIQDPNKPFSSAAVSKPLPIYNSFYYKNKFFDESNIDHYLAVDKSVSADFGIIVYSESMSDAGIKPGDIAFFTRDFKFIEGHIYAVWIMGNESVILKKVYTQGNNYVLASENTNIAPLVIENNQAIILGELFGIYKEWRWD